VPPLFPGGVSVTRGVSGGPAHAEADKAMIANVQNKERMSHQMCDQATATSWPSETVS
jgi:hypothetical protein